MHADPEGVPVEIRPIEAEVIAFAYHRAARGDAWGALVAAISDALADLDAAERRIVRQAGLVSRGYARCGMETGTGSVISRLDRPSHTQSDPEIGDAAV